MSVQINHEEVAKTLALEIADLKYQVAAYRNAVSQLEAQVQSLEPRPAEKPKEGVSHESDVSTV